VPFGSTLWLERGDIFHGAIPECASETLNYQCLPRFQGRDNVVDLDAVQRALDPQDRGYRDHGIAVTHQQIAGGHLTVFDESADCFLAGTFGLRELTDSTR